MIKINLLPREIYAAKAQRQIQAVLIGLGAVVVTALMGNYVLLAKKSKDLDRELVDAQAELRKYEAIDAEVKAAQNQERQLNSRLSVIKQLLRGTLTYPKFFEDFMALLPSDIWIGSLGTTTDASYGLAISVNAQSLSSFAVADWLTNLQTSPLISDVKLGAISVAEQGEGGRSALYSFTMNFSYRRTDN